MFRCSMATNTNSQLFQFGIGAGSIYSGVPPVSDTRACAAMQQQQVGDLFQIADLTNRMMTNERMNRDLAQAVAAQEQMLAGYRRGCAQIVENINTLNTYAQAVDARINEVDNLIHGGMSTGRDSLRALQQHC